MWCVHFSWQYAYRDGLTIGWNEYGLIGGRGLANYIADCRCAHRQTAICITSDYSEMSIRNDQAVLPTVYFVSTLDRASNPD